MNNTEGIHWIINILDLVKVKDLVNVYILIFLREKLVLLIVFIVVMVIQN